MFSLQGGLERKMLKTNDLSVKIFILNELAPLLVSGETVSMNKRFKEQGLSETKDGELLSLRCES